MRVRFVALMRRWPLRAGAAYLAAVVLVALLLVLPWGEVPPPVQPATVPAFGQDEPAAPVLELPGAGDEGLQGTAGAASTGLPDLAAAVLQRVDAALAELSQDRLSDWYRQAMELVLPVLPGAEDRSHGTPNGASLGGEWARQLARQVLAVDPTQPRSLLETAMPLAVLVGADRVGAGSAYIVLRPTGTEAAGAAENGDPAWRYDGENPLVLIYHSHTQESFLPELYDAPQSRPPGVAFSPDPERNMLRVGRVLAEHLQATYGIGVVHLEEYFDVPADGQGVTKIGSYDRSLAAVEEVMDRYPSLQIILDLHRDAPRRPITTGTVDGVSVAQVMLVVGTGERMSGPAWAWEQNNRFADELTAAMETTHPGLARRQPFVTEFRYNQHVSPGALLVEVGGVDNTMEEALRSARLFGDALARLAAEDRLPPYP